eukprot:Gb_31124 [translate_table: standard]
MLSSHLRASPTFSMVHDHGTPTQTMFSTWCDTHKQVFVLQTTSRHPPRVVFQRKDNGDFVSQVHALHELHLPFLNLCVSQQQNRNCAPLWLGNPLCLSPTLLPAPSRITTDSNKWLTPSSSGMNQTRDFTFTASPGFRPTPEPTIDKRQSTSENSRQRQGRQQSVTSTTPTTTSQILARGIVARNFGANREPSEQGRGAHESRGGTRSQSLSRGTVSCLLHRRKLTNSRIDNLWMIVEKRPPEDDIDVTREVNRGEEEVQGDDEKDKDAPHDEQNVETIERRSLMQNLEASIQWQWISLQPRN